MCTEISNMKTGDEAESPAEMAGMLGVSLADLIPSNGYTKIEPDCCLCQVDVPGTLKKHGWRYDDTGDPMDVDAWPPDIANKD